MLKRLAILGLAMLAVSALGWAIVFVTCEYQKASQKQKEQSQAQGHPCPCLAVVTTLVDAKTSENEAKKGADSVPCWYVFLAWPEGVTAWAIILTLGAITWQAIETRKSAQTSRDTITLILSKERPRISVSPPAENLCLDVLQTIWMEPVRVDISNDGFTQALNVSAYGGIVAIESGTQPPMEKLRNLAIPSIIKAESTPVSAALHFVDGITPTSAEDAPNMFFVYALGRITYEDFLGVSYETVFKYRLQMFRFGDDERATGVLGWQWCDQPAGNRTPQHQPPPTKKPK